MAPKGKKGGKKANDDWETEALGETPDPSAQATQDASAADAEQDAAEEGGDGMGGGLLAALKKNRGKKQKKGKAFEDSVEGEDPPVDGANGDTKPAEAQTADFASKAPEEATMDDEDVFGQPMKKGKGGKGGKAQQQQKTEPGDEDEDEEGEGGKLKTKKEKEKDKKEREKQRKKEQVGP